MPVNLALMRPNLELAFAEGRRYGKTVLIANRLALTPASAKVNSMTKKCEIHGVDLIVLEPYCPVCRATAGGLKVSQMRSKAERKRLALKAARARWGRTKKGEKK